MRNITRTEIENASVEQLKGICDLLREEIFRTVSECGGHLSSNLGTVELTVALHRVFDFPRDRLVFDVGHQCYAHKLLSGRAKLFRTLRKEGGLSGFPKREESEYDPYGTGHAGTAVSAALGLAKASDLMGEDRTVIALVGDGSFQNGLVYEALNSLKIVRSNVLIILNDNGMSISPTEGGVHEILDEQKEGVADVRLFERFGLTYRGPVNGNDLTALLPALEEAKTALKRGSVLLHVVTKKGLGYPFSENAPAETHGVSPKPKPHREYSAALGEELIAFAREDARVVAVTAAMTDSLGLRPFFEQFPERAFDVGICEEHATVLAAALAAGGMRPYYAVYSTFLQRSYDEILHDIAGQHLPVTICIDRAGITGPDGETHQGTFDLSFLSAVPGLTVGIPKDIGEMRSMLRAGRSLPGPFAVRYPRAGREGEVCPLEIGKFELLHSSISDIIVYAAGERCLSIAEEVRSAFSEEGGDFTLVNARFLKPLDEAMLASRPEKYVITLEDGVTAGGLGDAIARRLRREKQVFSFGYPDVFIPHGEPEPLMRRYGLDPKALLALVRQLYAGR